MAHKTIMKLLLALALLAAGAATEAVFPTPGSATGHCNEICSLNQHCEFSVDQNWECDDTGSGCTQMECPI